MKRHRTSPWGAHHARLPAETGRVDTPVERNGVNMSQTGTDLGEVALRLPTDDDHDPIFAMMKDRGGGPHGSLHA